MFDYFRAITIIPVNGYKVRAVITEDPKHNNRVFVFEADIKAIAEGIDPEIAKLGTPNGLELKDGAVVGICFRNATKLISIEEARIMLRVSVLSPRVAFEVANILEEAEKNLLDEYSVK